MSAPLSLRRATTLPPDAMLINGYEVEEAPNGAWWVRPAHGRRAWRFADRAAALRFAQRLRPPADAPDHRPPTPLQSRVEAGQRRRA
jgi:hypothetical protein